MPTYVWTPKPGSPANFWLSQQWAAYLATDNALGWLAEEIPLIGETFFSTSEFCAGGPYTAPPISIADLPGGRDPVSIGLALLNWTTKLHDVAMSQVFGALCEQLGPGTNRCMLLDQVSVQWNWSQTPVIDVSTTQLSDISYRVFSPSGSVTTCSVQVYKVDGPSKGNPVKFDEVQVMGVGQVTHGNVIIPAGANYIAVGGQADGSGPGLISCEVCLVGDATATYFTPAAQTEPEGFIGPTRNVYDSFATLGAELDNQELKLDTITALLRMQLATNVGQLVADGAAVPLASDGELAIPAGDVGLVVTLTSIAPGVDQSFGSPARYYHLGRVSLGSALGWLPPLDLVVSPMLIYPLPGGIDRVRVHVTGPSAVSVQLLAFGTGD